MKIAELVHLLYDSSRRVGSLTAEYRDWSKPLTPDTLVVDLNADAPGGLRWVGGLPFPKASSVTRRLWMESPNRLRIEISRHRELAMAAVRNESAWWLWNEEQGGERGGHQDSLPQVLAPLLIAPERLLPALLLEVTGHGSRAGREVMIARGVPREPDGPPTTVELEFDREYGTILRRAVYVGGVCTSSTEAISISYNEVLSPERFEFKTTANAGSNSPGGGGGTAGSAVDPYKVSGLAARRSNAAKTVWLTGLSGSGKTTLASEAERLLLQLRQPCCIIDEENLRSGLSSDLGYAREDSREQARRVAEIAVMLATSGIVPIVALVSPYAEDRLHARLTHDRLGIEFLEVLVDTPDEVCRHRNGEARHRLPQLSGVSSLADLAWMQLCYEPPSRCELVIDGFSVHPRLSATRLVDAVLALDPRQPGSRSVGSLFAPHIEKPT